VICGGDEDTTFGCGDTIDTIERSDKVASMHVKITYAFKRPLRVRELPSDSVACEEVGALGIPVDFLSRVVECVKEASRSSKSTMHRVGRWPISVVRVLSLILLQTVSKTAGTKGDVPTLWRSN